MPASHWIGLVDRLLRKAIAPGLWSRGGPELQAAKGVVACCVIMGAFSAVVAVLRVVMGFPGASEVGASILGFAGIFAVMRWTERPRLAAHAMFAMAVGLHMISCLQTGGLLVVSVLSPIVLVMVSVLVLGRRAAGVWAVVLVCEAVALIFIWQQRPDMAPEISPQQIRRGWMVAMPVSILLIYGVAFLLDGMREHSQLRLKQSERDRLRWAHKVGRREVGNRVLHHVGNHVNAAMIEMQLVFNNRGMDLEQSLARIRSSIENRGGPDSAMERLLVALANQAENEAEQRRANVKRGMVGLEKVISLLNRHSKQTDSFAELIALDELVADTIARAQARHGDMSTKFLVELSLTEFHGDWFKVSRIVENLVDNTLRHGPAKSGGKPGRVRISSRLESDSERRRLEFEIVDDGPGIPSEDSAQIFAARAADRVLVDGWGLHESANAARELGGSLSLVPSGDERWPGAHFRLVLPLPSPNEIASCPPQSRAGGELRQAA